MEEDTIIDFQLHNDYFTDDNRYFYRVIGDKGKTIAVKKYEKIDGEYKMRYSFITTKKGLSTFIDNYNEELDAWEDEYGNEHL